MKKFILALFLTFIGFSQEGYAQVLGAEIHYKLEKDTFIFTTKAYTTCGNSSLNDTLFILDSNGFNFSHLVPFERIVDSNILKMCNQQCNSCSSSNCQVSGIQATTFSYKVLADSITTINCLVELKFKPGNRLKNLKYMNVSQDTILVVSSKFSGCEYQHLNAPQFVLHPKFYTYAGEVYLQTIAALDKTNNSEDYTDSLYFEMTEAESENGKLGFLPGYNSQVPLKFSGYPNANLSHPYGFNFNKNTGNLRFIPLEKSNGILKFRVYEFRKQKLLGYIDREYALIVNDSQQTKTPIVLGNDFKSVLNDDIWRFSICQHSNDYQTFTALSSNKNDSFSLFYHTNLLPKSIQSNSSHRDTLKLLFPFDSNMVEKSNQFLILQTSQKSCPYANTSSISLLIDHVPMPKVAPLATYLAGRYIRLEAKTNDSLKGITYNWKLDGKQLIGISTSKEIKLPGKYPFKLEVFGSKGCKLTYNDDIQTPEFAAIKITNDTLVYCQNDTLVLRAKPINVSKEPHFEVIWSDKDHGNHITMVAERDTQIIVRLITSDGLENSDTIRFTVKPQPNGQIVNNDKHCQNNELLVNFKLNNPLLSFGIRQTLWRVDELNLFSSDKTLKLKGEGKVQLNVLHQNGCTYSASKEIRYNHFNTPRNMVAFGCKNEADFFKAESHSFNYHEWLDADNHTIHNKEIYSFIYEKPTFVVLSIKDTTNKAFCHWTDTFKIRIKPKPEIKVLSEYKVCQEVGTFNLNDTQHINPVGGLWYDPLASRGSVTESKMFNTKKAGPGTHKIWYEITDKATKCRNDTFINITVNPTPNLFLADSLKLCVGADIVFLDSMATPKGGIWSGNGVDEELGTFYFNPASTSIKYANTLYYHYRDANRCQNIDSQIVTLNLQANPVASVTFGAAPITIEFKEVENFEQCHVNKWTWYFGDRHNSQSNEKIARFRYQEAGIYNIALVAEDTISGIKDSVVKTNYIRLVPTSVNDIQTDEFTVVPNPVSSWLKIKGDLLPLEKTQLFIFNQLGQNVYQTDFNLQAIDVSFLKQGIYQLMLFKGTNKLVGSTKFIKLP